MTSIVQTLTRVGLPGVFFYHHFVHSIFDDGHLAFRNLQKSCYTEEKDLHRGDSQRRGSDRKTSSFTHVSS
jgi:hypothetical protein